VESERILKGGVNGIFLSCPPPFGSTITISRFGERFCDWFFRRYLKGDFEVEAIMA